MKGLVDGIVGMHAGGKGLGSRVGCSLQKVLPAEEAHEQVHVGGARVRAMDAAAQLPQPRLVPDTALP